MNQFIKSFNKTIPEDVIRALSDYERVDFEETWKDWNNYLEFSKEHRYAERLGTLKTLTNEEAFLFEFYLKRRKCKSFVEIGTQYGRSTRKILDIRKRLELDFKMTCFDVHPYELNFQPEEAEMRLHDVTEDFEKSVISACRPEIIFLDAHPYPLVHRVVSELIRLRWPGTLLIHDCNPGFCNPERSPERDDVFSDEEGLWERIALARIAGVQDPRSVALDDCRFQGYHLRILNTAQGLAVMRLEEKSIGKLKKSFWARWSDLR